ncbi:MAG: type II secretion system F family protein [Aquabacterium sp.]
MSATDTLNFHWTGRSAAGPVSGTLAGSDAAAVADVLRSRGATPLTIESGGAARSAAAPGARSTGALAAWFAPKVQITDLMLFSRQLNTLLRSGVPILRALAGLQESSANERMKATLGEVRRSLESGIELSMSLAQHQQVFDTFFVAMVRVGEMTGRLDEIFLRLFKHLEFELFMGQQVKTALRYPSFVVVAMFAAIAVINLMVVPAFANVFQQFGAQLPLPTRLLMASSQFTLDYGWFMLGAGVAGVIAFRRWSVSPKGRPQWDGLRLRLPLAGKIIRKATLARLARSFSLALKSGVPVKQALSVTAATVDNAFIAAKIEGMRHAVERGETILRAAAATGVFTPVVLQMIAVGEETGTVDELMDEVAELYTNDVQYELKTLSAQLEPILIVFLGILVLILALGVFLPVWDLGKVAFKK